MKYKLYVDGQLGLPFDSADDARASAESFQKEGYDTFITVEDETTESKDATCK